MDVGDPQSGPTDTVRAWLVPSLLVFGIVVGLGIDLPIARYCREPGLPQKIAEALENAEPFGHGVGATFIVIGVMVLDPTRCRRWWGLFAGSLGAGLVANLVKLAVMRSRPRTLTELPDSVWSTFGGFFSAVQSNATQSFPSAHTATAVGLATMLSRYYPRGRWYFAMLAILVGLQRISVSAHFPSDVCAGALLGWCVAKMCLTEPGIKTE